MHKHNNIYNTLCVTLPYFPVPSGTVLCDCASEGIIAITSCSVAVLNLTLSAPESPQSIDNGPAPIGATNLPAAEEVGLFVGILPITLGLSRFGTCGQ